MQFTLEIPDDKMTRIRKEAEWRNMTVDAWLLKTIDGSLPEPRDPKYEAMTPKERAAHFVAWIKSLPPSPPLSDEAISRENMYADRG